MKTIFFAALVGAAIITAGCVSTVSGTHTAAVPLTKDSVEGRYERTVDQVYTAAVTVVKANGVIVTEYIPHDSTNAVRSLQGKVNERKVWVRVESIDPKITAVTVQTRSNSAAPTSILRTNWKRKLPYNWRGNSSVSTANPVWMSGTADGGVVADQAFAI
ncbi:MAG: DUF3568 family protein [Limisphaerales bacterium]